MIPFDAGGAFHPRAGTHELRRLAVRSGAATIGASGLALVAQVISTVILARLLTPADFGVVAMVTTFSLLLVSFGLNGFTEAVIQCDEIDHHTASNLFWLNAGIAAALAVAFAASGSLLGRFFHNPLVPKVAMCMSVGIVISGASVIHLALLKRAMLFVGVSSNDFIGRAVNTVVAIVFALRGWGYWALALGIIAQQLSTTIGAWYLCRWIPGLPRKTGKTGALVWFAAKVFGQFTFGYSTSNIDNLLVGWRFNATVLGSYKKAFDLFALTASQLTSPLNSVALSALSRLNEDRVRFRRYLASSLGMIAFIGMAMSADLTLVGRDVVRLVLGTKWSASGRIFEIFGPGIGAMLLCSTVGWIHLSIGKPGRWMRWTFIQFVITTCMFLVALPWGPDGVAAAWSISFWTLLIPTYWYAGRPIGFGISDLIGAIWKYVAAALVAGGITAGVTRGTTLWGIPSSTSAALGIAFAVSILFISLYLIMVILFYRGLAPLRELARLLSELGPSRKNPTPAVEVAGGCE